MSEKRKRPKQIKVMYRQVPGASKEEIEWHTSRAFDILFEAILRNWDKLKNGEMEKNSE